MAVARYMDANAHLIQYFEGSRAICVNLYVKQRIMLNETNKRLVEDRMRTTGDAKLQVTIHRPNAQTNTYKTPGRHLEDAGRAPEKAPGGGLEGG